MDTLVYTADISALNDPAVFERLLGTVPAYRREKAMRFKFPSGRAQSLGVGLLLRLACRDAGVAGADENVVLGENGKPAFRSGKRIREAKPVTGPESDDSGFFHEKKDDPVKKRTGKINT